MSEFIFQLEEADTVRAGAILARSFLDEPVFIATIDDPDDRLDCCQALFTANLRHALVYGEAWAIGTDSHTMLGVAYWTPKPETALTPEEQDAFGFTAVFERWGPQLAPIGEAEAAALATLDYLATPWRYLAAIGIEPGFQGQGYGSALLAHLTQAARDANVPFGLTTDRERNVKLYERAGFQTIAHQPTTALGIPFWSMATHTPSDH